MTTKLIRLEDGTLVEVEAVEDQIQPLAGGFADKVNTSLDRIQPIFVKACRPIIAAWKEINQDMNIEKAEIELGVSFEGEGNVYVTKSKAGANLTIKLVLKPVDHLEST
jgi:TolB-like protein